MTTATATPASPLATFRQGRDEILASILGSVSGLEGSVLEFQNAHEGEVRAVRFELGEAIREQKRLQQLVGDQALELDSTRKHICAAPAVTDSFGFDLETPAPTEDQAPERTTPAPETTADADAAGRTIEELRSSLEKLRRKNGTLSTALQDEQGMTAGLRLELEERDRLIATLQGDAITASQNLAAAKNAHQDYVRDAEKSFELRRTAGVLTAENGVRAEAVRIIEAIAADNPALTEAVELFTVAFPIEAHPVQEIIAPAHEAATDVTVEAPAAGDAFFDSLQKAEREAPAAAETEGQNATAVPASEDDFLQALSAAGTDEAPAPLTQNYLPAPDQVDDSILDPNFFDTPPPAQDADSEESATEAAAKPSYGLFGRKKEESNA